MIPAPKPGLVFRYEYLWKRQSALGQETAEKERPACIVLAVHQEHGETRVLIVPITHSAPAADTALEIPSRVKHHLGLDASRSWIVLSEANIDHWPSPDMRHIPGNPGQFGYGLLPKGMVDRMRRMIMESLNEGSLKMVDRIEAPVTERPKRQP
ncbi:MAG TPA: hypothetical protein VNT30_25365 [Stellaceae bacterium]|nr:hypothetical protein [Stellaceae bacterium]